MQKKIRELAEVEEKIQELVARKKTLLKQIIQEELVTPSFGIQDRVLQIAREKGQSTFRPYEIYQRVKKEFPTVTIKKIGACISRLAKKGHLIREGRGQYRLGHA